MNNKCLLSLGTEQKGKYLPGTEGFQFYLPAIQFSHPDPKPVGAPSVLKCTPHRKCLNREYLKAYRARCIDNIAVALN